MNYVHTQRALTWLPVAFFGIVAFSAAWSIYDQTLFAVAIGSVGFALLVISMCFQTLTITDEGESLSIRFGPIALFRKRVPYAIMTSAAPDRTLLVDGWGIHYVPGRGWTWNLWGRSCVRLTIDGRTLRLGSDDADNLAAFLAAKIASRSR